MITSEIIFNLTLNIQLTVSFRLKLPKNVIARETLTP